MDIEINQKSIIKTKKTKKQINKILKNKKKN